MAIAVLLGMATAVAYADEPADLRQQLDALKSKVEQIDADLAETAQKITELNGETDAYRGKLNEAAAAGQKLKEQGEALAKREAQLEAEHDADAQLCHKTVSQAEYKATVAQCEAAGATYQQHADAYRQDEQSLAAAYASYTAETKELKARYDEIAKRRQDVVAQQASLESARHEAADRFNAARDRLIALQAKPQ